VPVTGGAGQARGPEERQGGAEEEQDMSGCDCAEPCGFCAYVAAFRAAADEVLAEDAAAGKADTDD
jgi:hypothetical protein